MGNARDDVHLIGRALHLPLIVRARMRTFELLTTDEWLEIAQNPD